MKRLNNDIDVPTSCQGRMLAKLRRRSFVQQLLDFKKNEANSMHRRKEAWEEDYEDLECPISDGSGFLLSDARTLNEFISALFSNKLLMHESLNAMLPKKEKFGFGLIKSNFGSHIGYGHSGRVEGFTSALTYFPEDKVSVAFLQNGSVYPINDILMLIGKILFNESFEIPKLKKTIISVNQQTKLVGIYENEKEGYKVIVDRKNSEIRLRAASGKGLLNKMILANYPLSDTRLFNPTQGIIFDFINEDNNFYNTCEMRVNGAKLVLERKSSTKK